MAIRSARHTHLQPTWLCFFSVPLLFFASCSNSKKAVYFGSVQDTSFLSTELNIEPVIQKSDLLSITVSSLSPEATTIFNNPNSATPIASSTPGNTGTTLQPAGYLVNQDGNIQFPLLGDIKAAGLSKKQLTDQIRQGLKEKKLLIDPIVTIRFLNFRVTVLGEVAKPTVINIASEKISLMEAIGLAGDLTIYGKRENILLIREEEGKKLVRHINLNSQSVFTSPYYYLKSNDVVYVEPNKAKVASRSGVSTWLPALLSGLALAAVIIDHYTK
jgi:polysaccharide export outer membrane protein